VAGLHRGPEVHALVQDEQVGELVHGGHHQAGDDAKQRSGEHEERNHQGGHQGGDKEIEAREEVGELGVPAEDPLNAVDVEADHQGSLDDDRDHGVERHEDESQQHIHADVGFHQFPSRADPSARLRLDADRSRPSQRRRTAQRARRGGQGRAAIGTELQVVGDLGTTLMAEHRFLR